MKVDNVKSLFHFYVHLIVHFIVFPFCIRVLQYGNFTISFFCVLCQLLGMSNKLSFADFDSSTDGQWMCSSCCKNYFPFTEYQNSIDAFFVCSNILNDEQLFELDDEY